MSKLPIVSDNLDTLFELLSKKKVNVRKGKWSLTASGDGDFIESIYYMYLDLFGGPRLEMMRSGDRVFIYDPDCLLNRKFLAIFGPLPDGKSAELGVRLTHN